MKLLAIILVWLCLTLAAKPAIQFDSDDTVSCTDINALDGQNILSLAFWLYLDSTTPSYGNIISDMDGPANNGWTVLRNDIKSDIFIAIRTNNGTFPGGATTTGAVPSNSWSHVAVLYDGTQGTDAAKVRCFINGSQATLDFGGIAMPPRAGDNSMPLLLGGTNDLQLPFVGRLDDVVVAPRVFTDAEIQRHYQGKVRYAISSPTAYYSLDTLPIGGPANGLTIPDRSGNNHHGTADDGANNVGCSSITGMNISYP